MKKYILAIAFGFSSLAAFAQEPAGNNVIKIAPLGLFNKVRLQYEHAFSNSMAANITGTAHYGFLFQGLKAEPGLKFYTSGTAPEGFYFQIKANGGAYTSILPYVYVKEVYDPEGNPVVLEDDGSEATVKLSRKFVSGGGGAGVGYQTFAGKKNNIALDFYLGVNYSSYKKDLRTEFREKTTDDNGNTVYTTYMPDVGIYVWYLTGPGSVINSSVSIGYVF